MARIAGVDLPRSKRIDIALTSIFGIGRVSAQKILDTTGIEHSIKAQDLTEAQVSSLREAIDGGFTVEGDLRKEVSMHIKRLVDLGTYKGIRHRKNLPVRGQRTSTNARTRKGPKKGSVSVRKKDSK
ncbi:MAG: 30S ribosomal protein S13 [Deltaproteobacteria bacterium]|nr:30S ribosomal protein S13 [Deltaproteobacteria bacterium]